MTAQAYDFRNPFMAAAIVVADGTRIPMWTNSGGQVKRVQTGYFDESAMRSLPYLSSLTVELGLAFAPKISAMLNPPYRAGIEFLNSPLIEWGESKLEVQFGYANGVLSPVFSGILMKPDVRIEEDVQITLTAVGAASALTQERGRTYGPFSRKEIIELLIQGPDARNPRGISVDVSEVRAASQTNSFAFNRLLTEAVSFTQGYLTDWMAIWTLVRQSGCMMMLVGDTLRIFPLSTLTTRQPTRTFRLYDFPEGKFGGDTQVYPILSFSSPTMAVYLPGAIRGIVQQGLDSGTREFVRRLTNDSTTQQERVGARGPAEPARTSIQPGIDSSTGDGGQFHPASPESDQFGAQARAEFAAFSSNMGVNLEIESVGIPDLLPGEVVTVRGVGTRLSANYGIKKVEHTYDGAAGVKFTAVSNTGQLLSDGLRPAGQVNDRPAQENASGNGSQAGGSGSQTVTRHPRVGR